MAINISWQLLIKKLYLSIYFRTNPMKSCFCATCFPENVRSELFVRCLCRAHRPTSIADYFINPVFYYYSSPPYVITQHRVRKNKPEMCGEKYEKQRRSFRCAERKFYFKEEVEKQKNERKILIFRICSNTQGSSNVTARRANSYFTKVDVSQSYRDHPESHPNCRSTNGTAYSG